MINEIQKLYNEGATIHQAIHRGVGQQAQRREKDELWQVIVQAVREYEETYKADVSIRDIKKEFDDRSIIDFLFGWADEMEYQARYKQETELALNAYIVSRLMTRIIEG